MPEPKIVRRCPSCGASVRVRAIFCSQCGDVLNEKRDEAFGATESKEEETKAENHQLEAIESETAPIILPVEASGSDKVTALANRGQTDNTAVAGGHDPIHRGTATESDGVEDDVLNRVPRLRELSSVVLDEASYDPSLRFVLVAATLFVVFLLILVLSKWIA